MSFVDGELADVASERVSRHMATCHRCRNVARIFEATDRLLDATGAIGVPGGFQASVLAQVHRRTSRRFAVSPFFGRLAAAAVILLLVGGFAAFVIQPRNAQRPTEFHHLAPVAALADTIELFENLEVVDDASLFMQIEAVTWFREEVPVEPDPADGST